MQFMKKRNLGRAEAYERWIMKYMKIKQKNGDMKEYGHWMVKWNPCIQKVAAAVLFIIALFPLFFIVNGLVTGIIPTVSKYSSVPVAKIEDPWIYWLTVCLWLPMFAIPGTLAIRLIIDLRRRQMRGK